VNLSTALNLREVLRLCRAEQQDAVTDSFCSISKGPFGGVGSVGRGRKNAATLTGSRGMLNRAG